MRSTLPKVVVFSHLRWDWVFQRPQHLLSRFATRRPVVVIEEPVFDSEAGTGRWEKMEPQANVTIFRFRTACASPGFCAEQIELMYEPLQTLAQQEHFVDCVAWFYTPCALPLLDVFAPQLVVYDCMDELSGFRGAPPGLLERERELFERADLVFTGGPSLYEAKRSRHPNVHCFPSSVEVQHFAKSQNAEEHEAQRALDRPRLGYYGVIDERIDLALVAALAASHPEWQIVLVGPVCKIEQHALPRAANIHYMGQQPYAALPEFLAGWDVCLMPFAMNEATRFISPTKVLEYMAAEKPIVSTPIRDVEQPYGEMVRVGHTHEDFISLCVAALNEGNEDRLRRVEKYRGVLAKTSWDGTASRMEALIDHELRRRAEKATRLASSDAGAVEHHELVIIGAGPTGLSAAYHAPADAVLLERNDTVGGWCRSLVDNGFTFDFAGHIMFSNDPYVHEMYERLLGDNVHWQDREAWIYSKNVYTRYPFQGALYGLPADVIKECIVGAIEARYGALKSESVNRAAARALDHDTSLNNRTNAPGGGAFDPKDAAPLAQQRELEDCCGDGVLESTTRLVRGGSCSAQLSGTSRNHEALNGNGHSKSNGNGRSFSVNGNGHSNGHAVNGVSHSSNGMSRMSASARNGHATNGNDGDAKPANFEDFIYRVWGAGIAKHFAIPYNRKLWAVPLSEMETSWLGGRVPLPDLEEMIEGALRPVPRPMGPNARFGYPLRGGFQALMNGFLPHVEDKLRLNAAITAVSPKQRTVTVNGTRQIGYDKLISTMPLPVLIRMMGDEAPLAVREAASRLRYVSVRCVNIGVGREKLTEKHWIYYPEDTVFHRIFVQGNASPHCNPPGGFGLTCEITYAPTKPLPCNDDELINLCIRDCIRVGLFDEFDPIWVANQVDMPYAYVVYDHERKANVDLIRAWLVEHDIVLAGRYSEWEYYNSDHAFLAGKKAVETALAKAQTPSAAVFG